MELWRGRRLLESQKIVLDRKRKSFGSSDRTGVGIDADPSPMSLTGEIVLEFGIRYSEFEHAARNNNRIECLKFNNNVASVCGTEN